MTTKLINGVVKDFQVGDRVIWDKAGNSIYPSFVTFGRLKSETFCE